MMKINVSLPMYYNVIGYVGNTRYTVSSISLTLIVSNLPYYQYCTVNTKSISVAILLSASSGFVFN